MFTAVIPRSSEESHCCHTEVTDCNGPNLPNLPNLQSPPPPLPLAPTNSPLVLTKYSTAALMGGCGWHQTVLIGLCTPHAQTTAPQWTRRKSPQHYNPHGDLILDALMSSVEPCAIQWLRARWNVSWIQITIEGAIWTAWRYGIVLACAKYTTWGCLLAEKV